MSLLQPMSWSIIGKAFMESKCFCYIYVPFFISHSWKGEKKKIWKMLEKSEYFTDVIRSAKPKPAEVSNSFSINFTGSSLLPTN